MIVISIFLVQFIFGNSENNKPTISRDGKFSDLVEMESPRVGDKLKSPIKISGRAPGNWFFEAVAPAVLVDWDGRIIGQSYITAEGDWMTTDLVNFSGEIEYTLPANIYSKKGALILRRNNPSDLPENDAALEIPIILE